MNPINAANELAKIEIGFLPLSLFNQIARLGVLSFIEIVALRVTTESEVEVVLTKREDDDPFWAGFYHNPGTVLRPTDSANTFTDPVNRLLTLEYKLHNLKVTPFFAGFYFKKNKRGTGVGIVSWIELNECPVGEFYKVNSLPKNIVDGQSTYIKKCASDFTKYKRGNFNPTTIEQLIIQ